MSAKIKLLLLVPLVAILFLMTACSSGKESLQTPSTALLRYAVVDAITTRNQLLLTGGDHLEFTARIVSGQEWVAFSPEIPGVNVVSLPITPVVFLYMNNNDSAEGRKAIIEVEFSDGATYVLNLTQQGNSPSVGYDKGWAEQPKHVDDANFAYKTYFTTLSNSNYVRNYSICYDLNKKVARWVAYPLHRVYTMPNIGRTDDWAYDPNVQLPLIPVAAQQYVVESYKTGYARGHQCPSADRYSTVNTNGQTFYATNIMPQESAFNGGIWGNLENKVRDNIISDTLYVVTGTHFADGRMTNDRKGNKIGLPSSCWKVLLRTRKGNSGKAIQSCTAEELQAIGFWMANDNSNTQPLASYALSVAEIEKLTGFSFFQNLPQQAAESVKAQKEPSVWKI